MAADYDRTSAFRGASFTGADFTGVNFRDCDLRQVKITDSWLVDVSVSGFVGNIVVNDVDATAFLEGELDWNMLRSVAVNPGSTALIRIPGNALAYRKVIMFTAAFEAG